MDQEKLEGLVVVFDREGYSAELYRFLDGRDKEDKKRRAIFISWAKYADKWVYDIPDEKFDQDAYSGGKLPPKPSSKSLIHKY